MNASQEYPDLYTEIFGFNNVPNLHFSLLSKGDVSAARLRYDVTMPLGKSQPHSLAPMFLVQLQLHAFRLRAQWCNGQYVSTEPYTENTVTIYDLKEEWRTQMEDPFDVVHFHVSQASLDALSEAHNAPRITRLVSPPSCGRQDLVMRQFAELLMPAFDTSAGSAQLYVGHVLLAWHEYIATAYGGLSPVARRLKGTLAPWQLQRAQDFMLAHMGHDITLEQVAAHCRMSVNHFVRAFRQTTGETPHRWLMRRRVDAAIELLRNVEMTLSMIACACGFSDQSHFIRVFATYTGMTPGNWRRQSGPKKSGNNGM